jgi:hypothetical protein
VAIHQACLLCPLGEISVAGRHHRFVPETEYPHVLIARALGGPSGIGAGVLGRSTALGVLDLLVLVREAEGIPHLGVGVEVLAQVDGVLRDPDSEAVRYSHAVLEREPVAPDDLLGGRGQRATLQGE